MVYVRRDWCTRHSCTVRGGRATYDMTKMKISAIIILSSSTARDLVRDQDEVYITPLKWNIKEPCYMPLLPTPTYVMSCLGNAQHCLCVVVNVRAACALPTHCCGWFPTTQQPLTAPILLAPPPHHHHRKMIADYITDYCGAYIIGEQPQP